MGQNRSQFSISFFLFALVFLIFDLEITLVFPFAVSGYNNNIYGFIIALLFIAIVTVGFVFELGKKALTIDSRQTTTPINVKSFTISQMIDKKKSGLS